MITVEQKIRELIEKDRVSESLEILKNIFEELNDANSLDEVILLSARFESNESKKRIGVITSKEFDVQQSQIRESILQFSYKVTEKKGDSKELRYQKYFRKQIYKKIFFERMPTIIFVLLLVVSLFQTQFHNSKINRRIQNIDLKLNMIDNNLWSRAHNTVNEMDEYYDNAAKVFFGKKLEKFDEILTDFEKGKIKLSENEINDAWTVLVQNSRKEIKALNILHDWSLVSPDSFGIGPQAKAIKKGVKITRVNVYEDKSHKDSLELLMQFQSKYLDSTKFKSFMISYDIFKTGENKILLNNIRSADFLIIDDNVIMINYYKRGNYGIKYSEISKDPKIIKYGIELHRNLVEFANNGLTN